MALTDPSGNVVKNYTYDPYGTTTATGETSSNPFQYTGRENDNTGLYYYRARYYDPGMGRFISSDPIGLRGGLNTGKTHLATAIGVSGIQQHGTKSALLLHGGSCCRWRSKSA